MLMETKYLMKGGEIRITKIRPSYNIHRSHINIMLAKLKMYRASMKINGFVVDAGKISYGNDGRAFIAGLVHCTVNAFDNRPMSSPKRLVAKERCAIAYANGFHPGTQWSTLITQASNALASCRIEKSSHATSHEMLELDKPVYTHRDVHLIEFRNIIKKMGMSRFEDVLRSADNN